MTIPTSGQGSSGPLVGATVPGGATFLGHPVGLFLLFLVEMWERFSFYGMRAILGLYLKCSVDGMMNPPQGAAPGFNPGRGWTQAEASNLSGWYGGMAYLLPIMGGLIADKLIGTHRSMVVGGLLIALGHVVLAISGLGTMHNSAFGMSVFVFGLVMIIVGTGHFKPSVTVMVNQLYPVGDPRREGAFGIFYMGINIGAFLGVLICGYLGERVGWHYGFGAAAVGMLAGLAIYMVARPRYLAGIGDAPARTGAVAPAFILSGFVIAGVVAALFHFGNLGPIDWFLTQPVTLGLMITASLGWIVMFVLKQGTGDRGPVLSIFIFMLFNAFFWFAFEQAATSINFFTDERVDRTVGSFMVPTTWFQNINPFVIVTMAPLFGAMWMMLARRNKSVPQPVKIGLGLIWLGVGFMFMVWAGVQAKDGGLASLWLVAATYVFHTIGELFLSPTGLSYVTKAAPAKSTSLLTGIWFLSSFIAYVVGGKVAGLTEQIEKGVIRLPWNFGGQGDFFFLFVVTSLGAGVLIIAATPLLRKLMRTPND